MHDKLRKLGITLTRTGSQVCPSCSADRKKSNTKCLGVRFKDNCVLYNCVHCGYKGIVTENKYNLDVKPKTYKKPKEPVKTDNNERMINYFQTRGIGRDIVELHKIGYNGTEIIFPFYKNNELVNIKYRTAKKTFRQEAQAEKVFFGLDVAVGIVAESEDYTLYITEGEFDSMSMVQAGYAAVSLPQGASDKQLECVENSYEFIKAFDNIVVCMDADEAGHSMQEILVERFSKSKTVYTIDWSKCDVKDANEALQRGGVSLIQEAVNNKKAVPVRGLVDYSENKDKILNYMFGDMQKGTSTGWSNVDELFRMQGGTLTVVTGYPSRGKSTVANNLLYNLSEGSNWKHLICSFENTIERQIQEFTEIRTGKNSRTNGTHRLKKEEAVESIDYLSDKFYLFDTDESLTIDDIIELATYAVNRYGVKSLVIDPYNRIKHTNSDREDKYIEEILSKLTFFAKQYDVAVIFIAHPKKPRQDGKLQPPTAYDISGSTAWYNMADIIICVHRDRNEATGKLEGLTQFIVQKVKGFHLGDPSGGETQLMMHRNRLVPA